MKCNGIEVPAQEWAKVVDQAQVYGSAHKQLFCDWFGYDKMLEQPAFRSVHERLKGFHPDSANHFKGQFFRDFWLQNFRICQEDGFCRSLGSSGTGYSVEIYNKDNTFGWKVTKDGEPGWSGPAYHCVDEGEIAYKDIPIKLRTISCKDTSWEGGHHTGFWVMSGEERKLVTRGKNFADLVEAPLQLKTWAYPVLGIGIAAAAYCGYKAFKELEKIYRPSEEKSGQATDLKKEKAKKQALIYGTAAIASAILSTMTYFNATTCPSNSWDNNNTCFYQNLHRA